MLPYGARPQSPPRSVQEDLQDDHQDEHHQRDRTVPYERGEEPAENGNRGGLLRDTERLEVARRRDRVLADEQVQVAGDRERLDVDDRPGDDLVGPHGDREPGVQRRDRNPRCDGRDQTNQQRQGDAERSGRARHGHVDQRRNVPAHERGEQHHALDADVDHPRALVHEAAQRSEGDGRREGDDQVAVDGHHRHQVADELQQQPDHRQVEDEIHGLLLRPRRRLAAI